MYFSGKKYQLSYNQQISNIVFFHTSNDENWGLVFKIA